MRRERWGMMAIKWHHSDITLRETGGSSVVGWQPPGPAPLDPPQRSGHGCALFKLLAANSWAGRCATARPFLPLMGSLDFSALGLLISLSRTFSELLCTLSPFLPKSFCFPQCFKCRISSVDWTPFLSCLESSSTYPSQAFLLRQLFMSNHISASPLQIPEVTPEI